MLFLADLGDSPGASCRRPREALPFRSMGVVKGHYRTVKGKRVYVPPYTRGGMRKFSYTGGGTLALKEGGGMAFSSVTRRIRHPKVQAQLKRQRLDRRRRSLTQARKVNRKPSRFR